MLLSGLSDLLTLSSQLWMKNVSKARRKALIESVRINLMMLGNANPLWEGEIMHRDGAESTKEEGTMKKPTREEADGKDKRQRRKDERT